MGLLDALGAVGDVLDTPRHLLWKHGISNLFGQEMNGGSDLLAALGADPEDFLTQAGGFGLDLATDPLTYLGGALATKAPGALRRAGRIPLGRVGQEAEAPVMKLFSGMGLPSIDREVALERGLTTGRADLKPLEYLPTQAKTMAQVEKIGASEGSKVTSSLQAQREAEIAQRLAGEEAPFQAMQEARQQALAQRQASPLHTFPEGLSQAEFENKLNSLYGVAGDLEGDIQAGQLRGRDPYQPMAHRFSIWHDILGGETEFARRMPAWMPEHPYAADIPHMHNPATMSIPQRNLTQQQIEQLVARHMQLDSENLLRRHFDAPPRSLANVVERQRSGVYQPGGDPFAQPPIERLGTRQITEALQEHIPWQEYNAASNRMYPQYDRAAFLLTNGKLSPDNARDALRLLESQGYPLDRASLGQEWQRQFRDRAPWDVYQNLQSMDAAKQMARPEMAKANYDYAYNNLVELLGKEMADRFIANPKARELGTIEPMIAEFLKTMPTSL